MDEITIPGNRKTEAKTFKVDEIYLYNIGYDWMQYISKVVEINNNQIIFETILSKKTHKAPTKQFNSITKTAQKATTESNKQKLFEQVFYGNFKNTYLT